MRFFAIVFLLTISTAFAQRAQTISADCLKLGTSGECITQAEFNTLKGATGNVQDQIDEKVGLTGDESVSGVKTFTGKITATSTTNGFKPCPDMTTTQRDAIASPVVGDCVYNTTQGTLNVFNGSVWKSAGGGVNQWATGTAYLENDVVIESSKLYIALSNHTAGTFATDLTNGEWQILGGSTNLATDVSGVLPMTNGGTDKALTPTLGGVVYTDAGSMEILAPGTSGQILQTNGAAAPSFVNKSISGKAGENSAVTLEEVQVPHNQLTETATNKHNLETGNPNKLINPSFEHIIDGTGWSASVTGTATATITSTTPSVFKEGNKSGLFTCAGGASGGKCLFYQDVPSIEVQGLVKAMLKASAAGVKIYTRVNGTNNLSKDVSTIVDTYKIPQVMGATTTGIGIEVTVAASQTINVDADEAFVGAQNLLTEVPTCNGSSDCEVHIDGNVNAAGVLLGSNTGVSSCSRSAAGTFSCTIDNGVFSSVDQSVVCSVEGTGGGLTPAYNCSGYLSTTTTANFRIYRTSSTGEALSDEAFSFSIGKLGADYKKAKATSPGFSTTNADTDWSSCGHTTSDFTGFGTVTNIETQCKRDGDDLLMRGSFISGTPNTGVEARVPLRLNGTLLTSAGISKIGSLQISGDWQRTTNTVTYFSTKTLIEPSVPYFVMGNQTSTTNSFTKLNGFGSAGEKHSFHARIPINGWENSNVIIGSFKEVPTIPGVMKPKKCIVIFGGTGSLTAPTVCSSSPCIEYFDSCGTASTTWSSAGNTSTVWAAGTWASSMPVWCGSTSKSASSLVPNDFVSPSTDSSGGLSYAHVSSNSAGSAVNSFKTQWCEGYAP